MGTPIILNTDVRILVLTPTSSVSTLSGTIAAISGQTIMIDWINGWAVNPAAGGPFGTEVSMRIRNESNETLARAIESDFLGIVNEVRSTQDSFFGGLPAMSSTGTLQPGTSMNVIVEIGGINTNVQLGGSVGYHYEVF